MKNKKFHTHLQRRVLLSVFMGMTLFYSAGVSYGASGVVPNNERPKAGRVCGKTIRALTRMWAVRASLS